MAWTSPDLRGRIAVVTGASRGVGRGIAHELGFAGATVYVTGRTAEGRAAVDGAPGTLEETARLVTEAGGRGIAVRCDHTRDADVQALADRVRREQRKLDVLVNNVWGGYEGYDPGQFMAPFWEQPVERWDRMMSAGLRAHYVASKLLVPLMLPQRRGLVAMTSAGDAGVLLGDVQYDIAKASVQRLAAAMAFQLRPFGIAALAVEPGFTRTERVLEAYAKEGKRFEEAEAHQMPMTHTPRFVGRCIAALAADARNVQRAGQTWKAGQLGLDYGIPDVDGARPQPWRMPPDYLASMERHYEDLAKSHPKG